MARLNTYRHQDYSGGLNDTVHQREIERNEASLLRNWDITYKGQLKRRDGLTQVGSDVGDAIDGAGAFLRTTGNKDVLIMEGGALHYLNGSSFDQLDTGFTDDVTTDIVYCPTNDKVYTSSATDTMHSWDRAATTLNSCLTDLGAAVPHGNVLRWHKNHMFTANDATVSGTAYPHRLYWSAIGDPDTWDTTNDFINVPGYGEIKALGDLGDALVIFKEYSIHFLSGWGDADWRISASSSNVANISETVGIAGAFAHTRVGNEIWYMDDEGIIRRLYQTDFSPFRTDIISKKIEGTLSGLNFSQIGNVVAHTWNDKVYFAVPTGANNYNDTVLVYDLKASKRTKSEAWTTYTGWAVRFFFDYPTSSTPNLYIAANNGKVYNHTGDDDDGSAIDARWDGKEDEFDQEERYKRYKYGYITGVASSDIDVEVHASVDDAAFADLGDLNLQDDGGTLGPSGTFELGPTGTTAVLGGSGTNEFKFYYTSGGGTARGKTLMHSIRHSVLNEQPTVNGFTSHYKQRTLR